MSRFETGPLTTHSFAWQRVGLVLSLSLLAAPLAPAVAPTMAQADEGPSATQVEAVHTEGTQAHADAQALAFSESADSGESGSETVSAQSEKTEEQAGSEAATTTPSATSSDAEEHTSPAEALQDKTEAGVNETNVGTDLASAISSHDVEEGAINPLEVANAEEMQAPLTDAALATEHATNSEAASQERAASDASETNQAIPDVTILYEADNGDETVKTDVIHEGSVVLPSAESMSMKAPAGTVFGGWYVPDQTTVHFYKAGDTLNLSKEKVDTLIAEKTPLTLYALWLDPDQQEDATLGVAKTPVFFTSQPEDGGTLSDEVVYVPDSQETVMDSVVAQPHEGYTFAGWYKDGEKISEDDVLDPTTIDGVISTDKTAAQPAVICASFVPTSEADAQETAPDLSTWRDPDSIARAQGLDEQAADGNEDEGPTPEDPNDERNTDKDTINEPSMDDPELIDQAAQSLDDPKFNENAKQISDPADNDLVTDPTDPTNTEGNDNNVTSDGTPGSTPTTNTSATTTKTTTTTTPYSSYSHYTASTPYKSTYKGTTSTTGTTGTSTYKASSYTPATSSSTYGYSYNAARSAQLAQTSDNAIVALVVFIAGFVVAAVGLAIMAFRNRGHKHDA